ALVTSQLGWATVVFAGVFALHFTIAHRDRAAIGEEGTSSTLRRWYMYIALLVGLLTMLAGAASVLRLGWIRIVLGSRPNYLHLSQSAGAALAGALRWAAPARP